MTKEEIKELFMQGIDCSQVVAGRFADELEMEESLLRKMSACFGGGMQCGETCGAVTGALMVLGLAGKGADEATALMRRFREKNQVLDCANLLRLAKERGEERKCHCDRMVYEAVELLEELLK